MDIKKTIRRYYWLTKPGIIYGNTLTAAGGFFLAAAGHVDILLLIATLLGLALVIGSGCVFNNFLDRGIDAKMARTRRRALVLGRISPKAALIYGTVLGLTGLAILLAFTNPLTAYTAFIGFIFYVIVYGYAKRRNEYGTLVGSISGAIPPVVGYFAVTGHPDLAAGLLFLILVLWQMPHFYAIAIFRETDYAAAGIPVLPAVRGAKTAKIHIIAYIIAFFPAVAALTVTGYTGYSYLAVMSVATIYWLILAVRGLGPVDDIAWARKVFFYSLIVLCLFSLMLALDAILP